MLNLILLHSLIYLLIFLDLFVEEHSDFVKTTFELIVFIG